MEQGNLFFGCFFLFFFLTCWRIYSTCQSEFLWGNFSDQPACFSDFKDVHFDCFTLNKYVSLSIKNHKNWNPFNSCWAPSWQIKSVCLTVRPVTPPTNMSVWLYSCCYRVYAGGTAGRDLTFHKQNTEETLRAESWHEKDNFISYFGAFSQADLFEQNDFKSHGQGFWDFPHTMVSFQRKQSHQLPWQQTGCLCVTCCNGEPKFVS